MALSLAPAPPASPITSSSLSSSSSRFFSANHPRPLRLPLARPIPRLHLKAGSSCRSAAVISAAPSSPSPATLDRNPNLGEDVSPFHISGSSASFAYSSLHLQSPNRRSSPGFQLDPLVQSLEAVYRSSPNGELSRRWQEYHGCNNWAGLLSPLDPDLRSEIFRYGDFAQLSYDAFDSEEGECVYEEQELFQRAGIKWTGYTVTKYIYASSDVHVLPKWLEARTGTHGQHESSWIGFIAVATDKKEIARLGRRDIVVVWRGTVTRLEWLEDIDGVMIEPHEIVGGASTHTTSQGRVGVERGFHTLYTAHNMDAPHGHTSASEQVTDEVRRLVDMYKTEKEQLSITMTGHSLGGALALLAAYDVILNCVADKGIPVSVISFAAPRVGNEVFKMRLEQLGVKVLRVVNINDMVPRVPGILIHEENPKHGASYGRSSLVDSRTHNYRWNTYMHVGVELCLDNHFSPFVKKSVSVIDAHNLELYLHLVDGYRSSKMPFISLPSGDGLLTEKLKLLYVRFMKRDLALINKTTGLLLDELHTPTKWQEKKLPKPSPRFSPSTTTKHNTTNTFNHFVHELLQPHLKDGTNLSLA